MVGVVFVEIMDENFLLLKKYRPQMKILLYIYLNTGTKKNKNKFTPDLY